MREKTLEIFRDLGIDVDPDTVMSRMSVSDRQMVEIAKAVSYDSKIIVLDEPTSSLNDREVEHLFRIIEKLKERGCGIIYISHKMEEILRISDEVTVMRDGKHVATEKAKDLTMDKIIRLMVGRELTERFPPKNNKIGEVVLKVDRLTTRYAPIRDVSFELRSGEIVGVAGLGGAGRTELLESIFGLCEKKSGSIRLHGREIANRTPREAKKNGFALLTEERRANGIFGILDITDNTVISGLSKYRAAGLFLNESKMKKDTEWSIKSMRIKTPSRATKIGTLSGGNQQKVILGRWLLTEPEVLLLDEPTRGIDVGAKYEIYQLMISLAEAGKCIMMVSSEMPELLGVCDRILVMSGGRLAGELDAKSATQEKIMELASRFA
jgi:methyl-galactoside transport system ATP-binding protein